MTFQELFDELQAAAAGADASSVKEHVAFQFNITGEAEGVFYLEIDQGKLILAPYDYKDRNVLITTTADTILKMMKGKLDPMLAFATKKIKVEGDLGKALLLKEVIK